MAYKRKTRKTGKISRSTVTHNTKGPTTFSHSTSTPTSTYTHTSKGGKTYTTRTDKLGNGFIERKRIYSSNPKRVKLNLKKAAKSGMPPLLDILAFIALCALLVILFRGA
jgi:hypothetical protein